MKWIGSPQWSQLLKKWFGTKKRRLANFLKNLRNCKKTTRCWPVTSSSTRPCGRKASTYPMENRHLPLLPILNLQRKQLKSSNWMRRNINEKEIKRPWQWTQIGRLPSRESWEVMETTIPMRQMIITCLSMLGLSNEVMSFRGWGSHPCWTRKKLLLQWLETWDNSIQLPS